MRNNNNSGFMFIDGMDESSELFIFVIVEVRGEGDFFLLSFIS